jgi:hypothetical protein
MSTTSDTGEQTMDTTRYYDATVDGHRRIAVATARDADDIPGAFSLDRREIAAADLPADFGRWQRYDASVKGDVIVEIMSRDGD